MVDDSQAKTAAHAVLAAVLQVREDELQALLWQRATEPFAGCWALPGGSLAADETLEESMRRHLAEKVDVREVSHLEQLETRSDPGRNPTQARARDGVSSGSCRAGVDPQVPGGHALASARRAPRARVRPRGDPPQRPRAAAGEALVHESRLRARAAELHARRAARPLRRRARPSGERDEPPARPAPAAPARGHGRAAALRQRRRSARDDLPFPLSSCSRSPISSPSSVRLQWPAELAVRTQTLVQPRRSNYRADARASSSVSSAAVAIPRRDRADAEDPRSGPPRRGLGDSGRRGGRRRCRCCSPAGRAARSPRSLEPVGGATSIRLARILAVAGICFTLSASIAVGLYELLLRLEH